MSIVKKLSKKPTPPAYAEILNQFPTVAIAEHLNISYSYAKFILNGDRKPGKALEQRFFDLAEQVEAELEKT